MADSWLDIFGQAIAAVPSWLIIVALLLLYFIVLSWQAKVRKKHRRVAQHKQTVYDRWYQRNQHDKENER
jgi:predicted Holliday junction resolvase-like endonuclease